MTRLRLCIEPDCGNLTEHTRCDECRTPVDRARLQAKRHKRTDISRTERRRRSATVAAWVLEHGHVCPGHHIEPHASSDLTADHIDPVAAGGSEHGPLGVLCRSCNSRKRDGR